MTSTRALAASLAASLIFAADAMAATAPAADATRLAAQYSDWAGGRSNADSLVAGLRNAAPITLVTNGSDRSVSIAGFTPTGSLSYGAVGNALSNAQRSLAKLGITKPSAEQIQAALIGGEITTASGATALVKGSVMPRGTGPSPVASR
jgi:hypothetical protein